LAKAGVPHPGTVHVSAATDVTLRPPLVVKPRYGSRGTDVVLCRDAEELHRRLSEFRDRPWFRRHGAIVQEAVPSPGHELRVIVAGGRVVGAAECVAAPGEWRTNISCGGSLRLAHVSDAAAEIARTAASAVGGDFVRVDLMPCGDDRFSVLEVNAAADVDDAYSFEGGNVYEAAAAGLGLLPTRVSPHPTLRSAFSG
jgi:glutathione synthase/RimK-type ligase-like ATP-grasp enzyme